MAEPALFLSPMPVFHICRDFHDITCLEALRLFSFFLIPAFAIDTDEHLPAPALGVVNMPVVAASGFESHLAYGQRIACFRNHLQIGIPGEILRVSRIRLALPKETAVLCVSILIDFHGKMEGRPCIRPASVKSNVRQKFCHFLLRHAILFGFLQMVGKRRICHALPDQCADRDDGTELARQFLLSAPHFTKKNIIIECCKFRRKISQNSASCCLFNHSITLSAYILNKKRTGQEGSPEIMRDPATHAPFF